MPDDWFSALQRQENEKLKRASDALRQQKRAEAAHIEAREQRLETLARESAQRDNTMIRVTWWILGLTAAAVVIGVASLIVAIIALRHG